MLYLNKSLMLTSDPEYNFEEDFREEIIESCELFLLILPESKTWREGISLSGNVLVII